MENGVVVPAPQPTLPEPLTYCEVTLQLHGATHTFTDCVEISFLSMLHAFLHSTSLPGQLDGSLVTDKLAAAPALRQWLEEHPAVLPNWEMRRAPAGVATRTEWASFLACRSELVYIKSECELSSSEENVAALWSDVAGLPCSAASFQPVCDHFSTPGRAWSCEAGVTRGDGGRSVKHATTFSLGDAPVLRWELTQQFDDHGKRVSGHSHIYAAGGRGFGGFAAQTAPSEANYEPEEWIAPPVESGG